VSTIKLTATEVRQAVSMPQAIDAVRGSFRDLVDGKFEMPTRTVLSDGQFLVMSAHHRPTRSAMVKFLSLNFDSRTPSILGTVTWSNLDDAAQVMADASAVTMLRTGAVTGVATDLLTPPDASSCAVIGAGAQGADQVRAVHAVRPLKELTVADTDLARADSLAQKLAAELGDTVRINISASAEEAVGGKDIVCCATTSREPLFRVEALPSVVHVNAIGAFRPTMREIPDELLADAAVVIDERAAALEESGEIIRAIETGVIEVRDLSELGHALQRPRPDADRTVFKSVGIAVQDWAIANELAEVFRS
jgi:ornithine cyclodeaminase/alanine dehydrogenase-like protein (mu-crystallin family)